MMLFLALPQALNRDGAPRGSLPLFDPIGLATIERVVRDALPAGATALSTGLIIQDQPPERVPWPGPRLTAGFALARLAAFAWALPPLLLALVAFDRFDPARRRRSGRMRTPHREPDTPGLEAETLPVRGPGSHAPGSEAPGSDAPGSHAPRGSQPPPGSDDPGPRAPGADARRRSPMALPLSTPVPPHPTPWRATLAEARLIWDAGPLVKWLLPAASLLAALLPAAAARVAAAAFLLLLVPLISEAAARERQHGTRELVFAQPGVPRSPVLWKAAAVSLVLLTFGAPLALAEFVSSPAAGLAFVTGLLFVAASAVGAGSLTGGGKLFSAAYLALWYAAVSGAGFLDYCGVFGGGRGLEARSAFLAAGAVLLAAAWAVERWRRDR